MDARIPSTGRAVMGVGFKIALFIAVLIAASYAGNWVMNQLDVHLTPSTEPTIHRIILVAIAIYIVLMMLPFVPGAEIGLGLMVMFGAKAAPLVYGCTVFALTLAFFFGRCISQRNIIEILETLRLRRAARLLHDIEPLESDQRLHFLLQHTSIRFLPFLLRHRFLALAVALNIPGNSFIGGGGGICLMAGFSRLFTVQGFALTVALAVSPVPLAVLIVGI